MTLKSLNKLVTSFTLLSTLLLVACKSEHASHSAPSNHSEHSSSMSEHAQHNHDKAMPSVGSQHELQAGSATIKIENAWVRPTVTGQTATGAFMRITASEDVILRSAQSSISQVTEVHEMKMDNDVMTMRELKQGLPLSKGQTVSLLPGGYHIMLMDLQAPVLNGDTITLNLEFTNKQGKSSTVSFDTKAVLP